MPIQATKAGTACFLVFGFWILDSGFCTLRHSNLTNQPAGQEGCTAPGTSRRWPARVRASNPFMPSGWAKTRRSGCRGGGRPTRGLSSNPFMPSGRAWRQEPSYDGYHYGDTP